MIKLFIGGLLALVVAVSSGFANDLSAIQAADAADRVGSSTEPAKRQILLMLHLPTPHFRPDTNYSNGYTDADGRSARRRIASEIAKAYDLKLVSDWPMPILGIDCYVMEIAGSGTVKEILEILSKDSRVEWAQEMGIFHTLGAGDPLAPVQPSVKFWHTAEIHKVATGRNVRVAVIDSGVEVQHPDLIGQVAIKENFIDGNPYLGETHGTEVAGIIAARSDNGIGIAGVAPDVTLMALRACWQATNQPTQCNSFTLGKALNFAILHDAQVINLSLTGPRDRLLERSLEVAHARGIKVIVASDPHSDDGGFPANYPGVFAVSDIQIQRQSAKVLIAPGQNIPTTLLGAAWGFVSGSSYAAAHVSGMVALLTQLQPSISTEQLRNGLHIYPPDAINAAGSVDVCASMTQASTKCVCSCTTGHAPKANNSL